MSFRDDLGACDHDQQLRTLSPGRREGEFEAHNSHALVVHHLDDIFRHPQPPSESQSESEAEPQHDCRSLAHIDAWGRVVNRGVRAVRNMRTASQCRAMARSCLSDSARTTDFRFKTALENAAKDWDVLAAMVEIKENREREAP